MAIHSAIPGITVSVCIDEQPLEEYDDEEEQEVKPGRVGQYQTSRTVRKYIESVSDKEFSVRVFVDRSYKFSSAGLGFQVIIDKHEMNTPCLTKSQHPHVNGNLIKNCLVDILGTKGASLGRGDQGTMKRFKFSKIETTTDDSKLSDVKKDSMVINDVGEIEVRVYRQSEAIPVPAGRPDRQMAKAVESNEVHEKALKGQAKSHSLSLGSAEPTTVRFVRTEKIDGLDFPIGIFKFKYRSKESLKQLLIIERTPSPEPERASASAPPAAAAVSIDNLNAEQKEKLDRFLQGLVGSGSADRRIKREHENDEGPEGRQKKRKSGQKVTIDLTEDSDEENIVPLN